MLICVIFVSVIASLMAASCFSEFERLNPDYIEFDSTSTCYFIFLNSTKFAAAELICRENGGHLASIHDKETNDFIAGQALNETDLWIGLTALIEPNHWNWTDNSELDYQNWINGSPRNIDKSCGYFSVTNGYWYREDCFITKPFICQRSKESICEDGFVYFPATKSCYGGRKSYVTWADAEEYCEETYNASLPSIESFTEFQFVSTYLSAVFVSYWVGIQFSDESQTWITVNGSGPVFLNWCGGSPKEPKSGTCVIIAPSEEQYCYLNIDCGKNYLVLCKKEANVDFNYRSCPPGYTEWNSKCYFVSETSSKFDEAELTCNEMGGHLASIHDRFQGAVVSQLDIGTTQDIWIGFTNLRKSAKWEWTDNSTIDYENWDETQLYNYSGLYCASASLTDGKWSAEDCNKKKPFVCEIEYQVPNCSVGSFYFLAAEACYGNGLSLSPSRRGYGYSQQYCANMGGYLPSIHSKYEFQLILSFVYSYWYHYWLGIRTFDGGKTWEADDGSAADFLDYGEWCDDYPHGENDSHCVVVLPFNGGVGCYQTVNCSNDSSNGAFFICKKNATFLSPPTTTTVLNSQFSTKTAVSATTHAFSSLLSTSTISTSSVSLFRDQEKTSKNLWYIIGSLSLIVLAVIIMIVFIYRLKQKKREKKLNEMFRGLVLGSAFGHLMNKYTEHSNVQLKMDDIEIDFDSDALGKGSNSIVRRAHFKQNNDVKRKNAAVAVKIPISYEKEDINLFKLELDAYIRVGSHPHIIKFYGWILYQNVPAIVLELATQNLLSYVRSFSSKKQFSTSNFISILLQVCQALKHIAALNIIHRDVACRNILMINNDYVKLADFGLCCQYNDTETYYGATSRKKLPLKWLSIEALTKKKFSEKSDVWSFGILCYEMFTCGNEPYSTFSNEEVLDFLLSGKRLTIPKDTSAPASLIMSNCWNENPNDRPRFEILEQHIKDILEGETAKYGYIAVNESFD